MKTGTPRRPSGAKELTFRAMFVGMIVAAIIGGSYPYIVLKLGFGPNVSVVSAFFGYLFLGLLFRDFNRWENNIVQTAGTSAGAMAFLCVLMAAFDFLRLDPSLHFGVSLSPWQSFLWLTTAGVLGILLAVPMRQHFIVDEQLRYPDGIATAETLTILDMRGPEAKAAGRSMGLGTALSAVLMVFREDARIFAQAWYRLPEMLPIGTYGASMGFGVGWSLLSLGSGMIIGLRVGLSMLAGSILAWYIAPGWLLKYGVIDHLARKSVLFWVMWPATGIMIAGGLTALFVRWRIVLKTFRNLSLSSVDSGDFPIRWVVIGTIVSSIALVLVQKLMLGMPVWMTLAGIVLSVPLMLIGLRVLGETNVAPISIMSNMMQAVFGLLAPGQIAANMIASGVTGSIAAESEALMQDFKTGEVLGGTARYLTYSQLLAVPVSAAAVSYVYPLLRQSYGIGGEHGLQSPVSQKWAGFAQLLSKGFDALPTGSLAALVIFVALGILLTILESSRFKRFTPSPMGLGIGMLVPGSVIVTMAIGGIIDFAWKQLREKNWNKHMIPLASGFIAGEAIVAVLIPILVAIRLLHLQP